MNALAIPNRVNPCPVTLNPKIRVPRPAAVIRHTRHPRLTWASEDSGTQREPQTVFEAGLKNHHIANTAYPIAHRKTIWRYRRDSYEHAALLKQALEADPRMCLYAHIPFCERRCAFCEYTVLDAHDERIEEAYHQALLKELNQYMGLIDSRQKELAGFDIGGGTPSLIRPERIAELMDQVVRGFRLAHGFGVSIETTPKIAAVLPDRLKDYHRAGIERISMGLQMVNPNLLREYGRDINRVSHNQQAVENIRSAGFKRFNIDLMYGFARQNIEDFQRTLEYTIGLDPEYITLYRMRYKGTKIANEAGDIDLIRVIRMYETAREILSAAGYRANPGKNGFSRVMNDPGTSEYLTQRVVHSVPYLGIGLGAQTFTNNILAYNLGAASKKVEAYLQAVETGNLPIQDLYLLPMSEAMGKMISVAFYFGEIHLGAFKNRFGMDLEHRFPNETAFVLEKGLMEYHGHTLRLTPEGARQFNGVIALFYSDRVKEHLLTL